MHVSKPYGISYFEAVIFFSEEKVDTGGELLEINLLCQIIVSVKS